MTKLLVLLRKEMVNSKDKAILGLNLERLALVAEELGVVSVELTVGQLGIDKLSAKNGATHSARDEKRSPVILCSHAFSTFTGLGPRPRSLMQALPMLQTSAMTTMRLNPRVVPRALPIWKPARTQRR